MDEATADRLLAGRFAPEDAPPGYGELAALIRASTVAASTAELAREARVVSQAAAVASSLTPITDTPPRKRMLPKLLSAKAAAAATVALFGVGTAAAAATGSLPGQTSHASSHATHGLTIAASQVSSTTSSTSSTTDTTITTVATTSGSSGTSIPATGPANQHAQFGLCTAFLAGNSATQTSAPPQDSSTAFKALIAQNGGIPATITYCQGVVKAAGSSSTSEPSDSTKPSDHGKPADTGKGSQSGKPPVSTPNGGGTGTADSASAGSSQAGSGTADTASSGASVAGATNTTRH